MKHAVLAALFCAIPLCAVAQNQPAAVTALWLDHLVPVDTSLWSPERVVRYREVAKQKFDPPVAVLRIPRLRLEAAVFTGSDAHTLDHGLGWIPGTAKPGSTGNTGIAGHRDSFFRRLKDIALDDRIELRTSDGVQTFVVRGLEVVTPSHVEVLAPARDAVLTLVTCYPFYTVGDAPERLIVHAVAAR